MPNRDTFRAFVTVHDDYEDEPTVLHEYEDYLAPGQRQPETVASVLRTAALRLGPEAGDDRSTEAIYKALGDARAKLMRDDGFPASRQLLLDQLWSLAEALDLEWWGVR